MSERVNEICTVPKSRLDYFAKNGSPHLQPIVLAVRDAGCAFAIITQGHQRFALDLRRPSIVIIGDDLFDSKGPGGFHRKSLRRLFAGAKGVSIVACEPILLAYAAQAAVAAGIGKLGIVIETRPRHEADWKRFVDEFAPTAAVLIATERPEGGVH